MPVRTATDDPDGIPASSAAYKSSPAESAEPRVGSVGSGSNFFTGKSIIWVSYFVWFSCGLLGVSLSGWLGRCTVGRCLRGGYGQHGRSIVSLGRTGAGCHRDTYGSTAHSHAAPAV